MTEPRDDRVMMHYEGDRRKLDTLICCFTWKGNEYRIMYYKIHYFAELYDFPEPVRARILEWAKMLNNPD